jgi:large subunit ribosomal protein L31
VQAAQEEAVMKEGIHPEYKAAKVVCACGNVIETRSTRGDFHIEICAACHPFFTGKQKIMDTAGRIERFKTRYGAQPAKVEPTKVAPAPAPKKAEPVRENRAAKRAKSGKSKPRSEAAVAPAEIPGEAKPE